MTAPQDTQDKSSSSAAPADKKESQGTSLFEKMMYLIGVMVVAGVTMTIADFLTAPTAHANARQSANGYQLTKWDDLLPKSDLEALQTGATSFLIPDGSPEDRIDSPISMKIKKPKDAYQRALISVGVQSNLNNKKVKMPGFIVPVDIQGEGITKTFFFVPYFGQCLHLPPPPPNQIIYGTFDKGYKVKNLYQPYYLEMTLYTKQSTTNLATAAYTAKVDKIYPFVLNTR